MEDQLKHNLEKLREMDEAFRLLRRLINAEYNRFNVHGLGMTEGKMVLILDEHGPQKASAMAELLRITSGAVTGIADRLIEHGYIERTRSDEDRRIVYLEITDEGRKLVGFIHEMREQIMFKLYDGFAADEMEIATNMFNKMSRNLELKNESQ
ncbi:MarR family winged helix-turn-helix transcriptional regulator [Paenibacillus sp. NEAU-GSW1]|uniref:MarR family winged helix-turn-helix transcriptional regulator n=1 Tax=Paenibacillus sp. NEAU-GSW1 TaxID=2682486 RepID=UPI0012E1F1B5|nr:MarR family transcriptional regulator [Paenibacillus sp. NEAU-GSW1]MUT67232.1 MarR family transcriptional regulator [Paenibacillus sp. NEAU-GSW1]